MERVIDKYYRNLLRNLNVGIKGYKLLILRKNNVLNINPPFWNSKYALLFPFSIQLVDKNLYVAVPCCWYSLSYLLTTINTLPYRLFIKIIIQVWRRPFLQWFFDIKNGFEILKNDFLILEMFFSNIKVKRAYILILEIHFVILELNLSGNSTGRPHSFP